MTIKMRIQPLFVLMMALNLVMACAENSPKSNDEAKQNKTELSPEPTTGPNAVASKDVVTAQLFITLVASDGSPSIAVSADQALSVLKNRCQSCHGAAQPTRTDLSILPTQSESPEIVRRLELDISDPAHMPVGSALPTDEKNRLLTWLKNQVEEENDRFATTSITIRQMGSSNSSPLVAQKQGPGRYRVILGDISRSDTLAIDVEITRPGSETVTQRIVVSSVPEDGKLYRTLTVMTAEAPTAIGAIDVIPAVTDSDVGDPILEPTPIPVYLDLRLLTEGVATVSDQSVLEILSVSCKACHHPQNPPRWDFTSLPTRASLGEIARRVNLPADAHGRMPVGGTLPREDLETLNRWIIEQQNPTEALAGYSVQALDVATETALAATPLEHDRSRIDLGSYLVGASVDVRVTVTGADGLNTIQSLNVLVAENGVANADMIVAARDTSPPVVEDPTVTVHDLTATSATIRFRAARDDRPSEYLSYSVYRSPRSPADATFDSVADVRENGTQVGANLSGEEVFTFEVGDLEAAEEYVFNVIVTDRTGNSSLYQKVEVLTMPLVLCDEIANAGSLQAWRNDLARRLDSHQIPGLSAVGEIKRCFAEKIPQCLTRTLNFAQRNDIAPSGSDGTLDTVPQKRPPDEIIDTEAEAGMYWIPDNIEQIAADRGWTAVRYKSRHAGGFDRDTPNLLMVYVPGDKVDPPVTFDRWLNFPLPIDDDEPAMGLPQNPRPKFGPPKREDYSRANRFPSTFTMMSQERATADKPATVYFQMFFRGDGPSFRPGGAVGLSGCVRCHPNGLRAIAPLGYDVRAGEAVLPDDDWKAVHFINRMMVEGAGHKAANWGEGMVNGVSKPLYRADRGPILGPAVPVNGISRSKEFIMGGTLNGQELSGCFNRNSSIAIPDIFRRAPGMYEPHVNFGLSDTPHIDPNKVIAAMNCEGCHVKGQRWPLNEDTGRDQIRFKILVDQSMPMGLHMNPLDPGNDTGEVVDQLTADERFALVNCLEAEFELEKSKRFAWLTQDTCQQ